jgi:hypothetical protein
MPFDIDASPLFRQPAPSPLSQGISGIGNVLDAIIQRRQQKEMARMQQEAQATQARLDREAQRSHWDQIDARERDRLAGEERQRQGKTRAEMAGALAEDYQKNQGRNAALIAQGYGGKLEDVMEPTTVDPRAPALADIDEDPSAPPVQTRATGRKRVALPGSEAFEFEPPPASPAGGHFEKLRAQLMSMPPSPLREVELRRLAEAEAAGLDPKGTISHVEDERQRRQGERNSYISAGLAERRAATAGAEADRRADERDKDAARKKVAALADKAANADAELATMDAIVRKHGGVPAGGPDRDIYDQAMKRASGAIALVESGNPESEASDPTKRSIQERIGTGRMGAAVSAIPGLGPLIGSGGEGRALPKIAAEREALKRRIQERAKAFGVEATGEAPAGDRLEAWKRKAGKK